MMHIIIIEKDLKVIYENTLIKFNISMLRVYLINERKHYHFIKSWNVMFMLFDFSITESVLASAISLE